MKKLFLIQVFLVFCIGIANSAVSRMDSLYQSLDLILKNTDSYFQIKESRINGLKRMLNEFSSSDDQRFLLNNDIFNEYAPYQCDSALTYLSRNILLSRRMGDEEKYASTLLMSVTFLIRIGMYKEACDYLFKLDTRTLTGNLKEEYWYANYSLYNEMAFATRDMLSKKTYEANVVACIDTLLAITPKNSMRYLEVQEKLLLDKGDLESALRINNMRFENTDRQSPQYGNVGFMRSLIYWFKGNTEEREMALLLTSITDIESAKRDIAALNSLSTILYNRGEIDRAYRYMQYVVECAKHYNGTLRVSQISEINSLVNSAYFDKEKKQKQILTFAVISISLLCAITFGLIFYVIRQMKLLAVTRNQLAGANVRMSSLNAELIANNDKLKDLNTLKEGYITLFLEMCSSYIDKLDDYNLRIHRKLVVGKYEEVLNMTNAKKATVPELKEFYDNFDKTFVNLYPTFIDEFNNLLRKDERIEIKRNEFLSTELRIFALIRLGITDSGQIASFLRCSVNTVYTYRTKIKNKAAINRDDFEEHIQSIGGVNG